MMSYIFFKYYPLPQEKFILPNLFILTTSLTILPSLLLNIFSIVPLFSYPPFFSFTIFPLSLSLLLPFSSHSILFVLHSYILSFPFYFSFFLFPLPPLSLNHCCIPITLAPFPLSLHTLYFLYSPTSSISHPSMG